MNDTITPAFAGEMQLAGWSESHTGGCKVTFWLSSPDELTAFRALTVRKGNTAGHRFMAALVEIGDDEKPVQPILPNSTELKPRMGDACYRTVMWCQEASFWKFLSHITAEPVTNAKQAADMVKFLLSINSRNQIDTDKEANKVWHQMIREPYRLWLVENQ